MTERKMMQNRLRQLEGQAKEIRQRAATACDQVGKLVNPLLSDFIEMDIPGAAGMMDQLVTDQAELLRIDTKIEALKAELYG